MKPEKVSTWRQNSSEKKNEKYTRDFLCLQLKLFSRIASFSRLFLHWVQSASLSLRFRVLRSRQENAKKETENKNWQSFSPINIDQMMSWSVNETRERAGFW